MRRRSNKRFEIRPETVSRIVVYGLLLLAISVLQCSFFARLRFLPATPDLMLGAVVGILLLDSDHAAMIAAVVGGFLLDAVGGVGVSFSPLLYFVVVATMSLLSKKVIPGWFSFLVLLAPSLLFRAGVTALGLWLTLDSFSVSLVLRRVLLPEALMTFLFGILVYTLVRLCQLPIRNGRDRFQW